MADRKRREERDAATRVRRSSVTRRLGPLTWEGGGDSAETTPAPENETDAADRVSVSPRWNAVSAAMRRVLDIVLSAVGLVIGAPLLALIAIAVKVDSPGPILYRQIRIGRDRRGRDGGDSDGDSRRTGDMGGRPFVIYKFRTMYEGAEKGKGPTWASEEDDRTTRIGRFLRKYRLDELPQLWNVLKGDMSLVGPRPERPQFVNELRDRIPGYQNRQRVKPGITGWAQVHQKADQSVDDVRRKLRYDLEYLENRSLLLDLSIILRTPVTLLGEWTNREGLEAGSAAEEEGGRDRADQRDGGDGMNAGEPQVESSIDRAADDDPSDAIPILLATSRRWLTAGLDEVLTPEGFDVVHVSNADGLERAAEESRPDLVIVDEELPGMTVEEMARSLVSGPLGEGVPLVLYTSSSVAGAERHARALRSGFWDLIKEPVRAAPVIAKLRRLLSLSGRLEEPAAHRRAPDVEKLDVPSVGFLDIEELSRVLPALGALAERQETSVSLVLLGPTSQGDDPKKRSATASLCGSNVRRADFCAWGEDAEVAIVAYGTGAEGARALFERLDRLAAERSELSGDGRLSAGIVELKPSRSLARAVRQAGNRGADGVIDPERIGEVFHLTDARGALDEARDEGGGARVVEVV